MSVVTVSQRRQEFEALIVEQLPILHSVARRLTRNPADAEDLVQETCIRAYRFFDRFERGTNFRAWALRILKNLFLNDRERLQAQPVLASLDDPEHPWEARWTGRSAQGLGNPERELERVVLSEHFETALGACPVEFRMVVTLCLVEGLSYQETADALEIPIGTVMSRLHRGRRFLQARLIEDARAMGLPSAAAPAAPAAPAEGA